MTQYVCPNCGSLYESPCLCVCFDGITQTVELNHYRQVVAQRIAAENAKAGA